MNAQDIASVAAAAGFSGEALRIAIAVALAESGGNPQAHNSRPPDDSYGLWQINMLGALGPQRRAAFGLSANSDLFDPMTNARAAFAVSGGGSNWNPWSTFNPRNGTTPKYLAYLPAIVPSDPGSTDVGSGDQPAIDLPGTDTGETGSALPPLAIAAGIIGLTYMLVTS